MKDEDVGTNLLDESQRVFGHLTVIRPTGELIRGLKVYECRCSCGKLDKATISLLKMGRKTSCGCRNRSRAAASKSEVIEVERLRVLLAEDGRPVGEIAVEAGLSEAQVVEGLSSKRKLTLAATASLLKVLGKHWSDLDQAVKSSKVETSQRNPLPRGELGILPNGARPRYLAALLTRNRLEPPRWPTEGRTRIVPFADGEGQAFGGEWF